MRLPDPATSRALVLGCSSYVDPALPALPAVSGNRAGMHEVLTSPWGTGLAPQHCLVLPEADHTPAGIGSRLTALAAAAGDMLLVYYAGHGLIGPNGELFLALPHTRSDRDMVSWTALAFHLVRSALAGARARNRVLILDCCFSGLAIDVMSGVTSAVAGQLEVAGTCTLASSPASRPSSAPLGAQYTAYTGEFVHLLRHGSPGQPELLTLTAIHDHLVRALSSRGFPTPEQRNTKTVGQLALARNRQWTPPVGHIYAGTQHSASAPRLSPPVPLPARAAGFMPAAVKAHATAARLGKRPILLAGAAAAITALLSYLLVSLPQPSASTVTAIIGVGKGPYGVAVNPAARTAYVVNQYDDSVSVINTATDTVTATINVGKWPVLVAVNPATHTAYVTNYKGNSVSVINTATNTVTATIGVGQWPTGVAVDPATHTAYITNYKGNSVSVINTG